MYLKKTHHFQSIKGSTPEHKLSVNKVRQTKKKEQELEANLKPNKPKMEFKVRKESETCKFPKYYNFPFYKTLRQIWEN
jgi:hypothetical protein